MRKWVFLLMVALLLLLTPLAGGCGEKKYDLTISVSPTGGGTTSPAVGTHEYDKDEVVTITATPATGYQFVNWSGSSTATTAATTVTMTSDKSVTANFTKIQYTLTIAVSPTGGGTTNPTAGTHTYDAGDVVDITATAATGYHFVNWTGDATGTTATVSVTMSANKTVTANFAISAYTLTMAKVGNGTIVPDMGAHTENAGTVVNLTADPDDGWRFDEWTGDVTTVADVNDDTTTVTMNGNYTITANFIQIFTLTMAIDDSSHGTITPVAGPSTHDTGTPVNLIATPNTGWAFVNWTGDVATVADVDDPTTTVTMNGNYTITANFVALAQYTLTMAVAGNGTTNPGVGPNTVYEGVNNISATPDVGWKFVNWSGDVSKVANVNAASTTIDMDANYSITANFVALAQYTLTMAVDDASHGSTTPPVGASIHYEETVVNITATALVGWKFDHWSGDVGTVADVNDPTTTVTMNGDYTITANFVAQAYPGVGSQWVYTVTYGSEVTTWTVNVTTMEPVDSVNCYKTETTFSSPNPVRTTAGTPSYTVTLTGADAWRSQSNLAQYKAVSRILLGTSAFTTTMTDTYTAGTPGFFTVGNGWSFTEVSTQPSTTNYTVSMVGQENVGSYLNCYKVEYSVSGTVVKTEWWSPDVMGIMKQVDTGTYVQAETRELVSFTWAA